MSDFELLRRNYPTNSQAELFNELGGGWPALIGNPNYENTCAIRLSAAHFRSGKPIPGNFKEAIDGDSNAIIVSALKSTLLDIPGQ